MASDQMMVAALGRPFTLGMLYDARKDELRTGFTLWDKNTLHENRSVHAQHSSEFEITASDSIESKSSLLDVNASLKASFLCGLIEVEGSAKYLNDQKKFKNQSRVTLQYKATTTFEQLSMTHEQAKNKLNAVPENESATHVVTGILYGANAFFVFDSEKLDSKNVKDIQGSMHAVIKKIPTFEIEGKVNIQLTEEEKALTNKFSCKFYGDFILENNPTTFEDAVKTYSQLPKLLGQKQEIALPLKVYLTPLKKFHSTAVELKTEICTGLVRKAEKALEDVGEAEMRCNDSLEDKVVKNVPQISKKLRTFQQLCKDYKSKLQQTMEKKFPLIRAGEDDTSVEKLFDDRKKSHFSYNNLNNWMNDREKEINVIRSCVEMMAGTKAKMVASQSELDREILAPGVDHALCFVFTSVERDDPYLDQMDQYLHAHGSGSDENVPPPTQDQWFTSDVVLRKMREKARAFRDFARAFQSTRFCFLVAALPNAKYKGATIYHYKDSFLETDDFSKPNIPDVTTVTDRRDLIWYACDLILDPVTASTWLTLSEGNKKATCGQQQKYPDCPERFDPRPQVLCTEALSGRHYWEVEWSKGQKNEVGVGVTYKGIVRKGKDKDSGIGSNDISWYFGEIQGTLCAWHDGQVWSGPVPPTGCKRVGVYLDWPAGTVSFYDVTFNTLSRLYTFTTKFTEPVYPGFYVYHFTNYVSLSPV